MLSKDLLKGLWEQFAFLLLLTMQPDKQQPWKIYIHAKAKHFNFKLKATTSFLPSCKLFPFSINIKLRHSLLKVRSKPQVSFSVKRKSFKSKFLRFLGKFHPRPTKDKAIAAKPTSNLGHPLPNSPENRSKQSSSQEAICIGSAIFGCLAVLSQSISQKDRKRAILCSLIILFYLALVFKKFITRRTRFTSVISIVAILSCSIVVYLNDISKLSEAYVLDCVWKAWNFAAQVIFTSYSQYIGAHKGDNYIGCCNF
ncbi:uncharacterized protein LOC132315081 [Cornus florida]|uniref:uncharacterized protein LOC132315081 n=1 Tax=Cornus florida TaxID=4283 RepID=UPI00289C19A1|nr:uncharacterized protein LOC132315081 [Cornus florida]